MATLTIRLVRSFEYRNMKTIVLKNVDLDISVEELKVIISAGKLKEISQFEAFHTWHHSNRVCMKTEKIAISSQNYPFMKNI